MPRASMTTLLPLSTYAKLLGLDPLHFCQGVSAVRLEPRCSDVWFQYDWQYGDRVGRETVARLIAEAERDIADELGYWPAPVWIEQERHEYPHPRRIDLYGYGYDAGLRMKSIGLNYGYVLAGGRRAATLLGAVHPPVRSDEDGDTFEEWVTFRLTVPASLDSCEVKAYFIPDDRTDPNSTGADPRWEIRPINASMSGTTLTVRVRSWELLRPDLQERLDAGIDKAGGKPEPLLGKGIDADLLENYVEAIELYRVYTNSECQVIFGWADSSCGNPACAYMVQNGCMRVKDNRRGSVVLEPGTYNNGSFTAADWAGNVEPDVAWMNYRSGFLPLNPMGCDELDDYWAMTIMMLATARLDRPLCSCTNTEMRINRWRADMALVHSEGGASTSYLTDPAVLTNPFGTRVGEYEAWKRVHKGRGRQLGQAVKV